jgi:quinol monooxygenase YgiN
MQHVIVVKFKIKEPFVAPFEAEIRRHAGWVRANEKGCVLFEVSADKTEPRTYHLYEVYKDDAALHEHENSPSLKQFGTHMREWVEERARWNATRME